MDDWKSMKKAIPLTPKFEKEISFTTVKELLRRELYFLYVISCIIIRELQICYPNFSKAKLFESTINFIHLCVDLSLNDLGNRPILQKDCAGCPFPVRLAQESLGEDVSNE